MMPYRLKTAVLDGADRLIKDGCARKVADRQVDEDQLGHSVGPFIVSGLRTNWRQRSRHRLRILFSRFEHTCHDVTTPSGVAPDRADGSLRHGALRDKVRKIQHPDRYWAGLGLPWSKQTEWPAVRNFGATTGIGAENGRDQVAAAWRSVIRVNSEGRPSRSAKPGHSPVPLFTYSVIPSTS